MLKLTHATSLMNLVLFVSVLTDPASLKCKYWTYAIFAQLPLTIPLHYYRKQLVAGLISVLKPSNKTRKGESIEMTSLIEEEIKKDGLAVQLDESDEDQSY